jgi:hypothetical protein
MMRCKLGFMAMVLGVSPTFVVGCDKTMDEGDPIIGDDLGDSDEGTGDGAGTGGETGDARRCAGNETAEGCLAELGCVPVFGQPLYEDGVGGWCTDATELYIGCVDTLYLCPNPDKVDCGDPCPFGEKILCDEAGYWQTSGCVPDDLAQCEAPGELSGAC